jgi:hypothetical protein
MDHEQLGRNDRKPSGSSHGILKFQEKGLSRPRLGHLFVAQDRCRMNTECSDKKHLHTGFKPPTTSKARVLAHTKFV